MGAGKGKSRRAQAPKVRPKKVSLKKMSDQILGFKPASDPKPELGGLDARERRAYAAARTKQEEERKQEVLEELREVRRTEF